MARHGRAARDGRAAHLLSCWHNGPVNTMIGRLPRTTALSNLRIGEDEGCAPLGHRNNAASRIAMVEGAVMKNALVIATPRQTRCPGSH
jgi:hypothetical protein